MSNYTKSTNFAVKDALTPGDPSKTVRGSEIDTEYTNLQTAVNSKADTASPTFTGTVTVAAINTTDTTFLVKGSGDSSKIGRFEVDTNVPTSTTRIMTFPSVDGTLALTSASDGSLPQIYGTTISATVGSNALTIGASTLNLDFRSATLGSGAVTRVSGTPANLVIPATATLGTINAIQSRIMVLAMNNGGTIELAAVNILNPGMTARADFSETGLVTTDATTVGCTFTGSVAGTSGVLTLTTGLTGSLTIGQALSGTGVTQGACVLSLLSGSLGANASTYQTNQYTAVGATTITGVPGIAVYSTASRTNLPYRVIGYVESTQTTAGTWAIAPSTIQGAGGLSIDNLTSFGSAQGYQNVTASRVAGTTYYNTTGRPIFLIYEGTFPSGGNSSVDLRINNLLTLSTAVAASTFAVVSGHSAVIPPNASYSVSVVTGATISRWCELR